MLLYLSLTMVMDIKRLDIYRKIPKDLTQPTTTGAVVSICCVAFIFFMILTEVRQNFCKTQLVEDVCLYKPDFHCSSGCA